MPLEWKTASSPEERGAFEARVYLTESSPDGDGDVIRPGAVEDGHKVIVSLDGHDSAFAGAEPAGEAKLFHIGSAVHAIGEAHDTPRGHALRDRLVKGGPRSQWSIGWDRRSVKSRPPTPEERRHWPDAKRVITQWAPFEISPVRLGACGPSCRTLGAKGAGSCGCDRDALRALVERWRERDREIASWEPAAATKASAPLTDEEISQYVAQFRLQYYGEVKTIAGVHPALQARAARSTRWAAGKCGIAPPQVFFVDPADMPPSKHGPSGRVMGLQRGDAIYLSTTVGWDRAALERLAYHETAHAARAVRGLPNTEELVDGDVAQLMQLALEGG